MPLVYRRDLDRKLTSAEVDGNWDYVIGLSQSGPQGPQGPAGGGGTSSIQIDSNQISFGTGDGLTSSSGLSFDNTYNSLIFGDYNTVNANVSRNISVIGGHDNRVLNNGTYDSCNSGIFQGQNNLVDRSHDSIIMGGKYNQVSLRSVYSSIVGGNSNQIWTSPHSSILGGSTNCVVDGTLAGSILGGSSNIITSSDFTSIIGGRNNSIAYGSQGVSILGGCSHTINNYSRHSSILGGYHNYVYRSINSSILGGCCNNITYHACQSSLIGGYRNTIQYCSANSSIIGGYCNTISSTTVQSSIIGGYYNCMECCSERSSIIGGSLNNINCSKNSSIIGGGDNQLYYLSNYSSVIGGGRNGINYYSQCSSIIGGYRNLITSYTYGSLIGGGWCNLISDSSCSILLGGTTNKICDNSSHSSIIAGYSNCLGVSRGSSLIGGRQNEISGNSHYSSIIGSEYSTISPHQNYSSIIGGRCSSMSCYSWGSSIIGGCYNQICCRSCDSTIVGGCCNKLSCYSSYSSVIGGYCNVVTCYSFNSTAIGGCCNLLSYYSCNSSIIGGGNGTIYGGSQNSIVGGFYNKICYSSYSSIIGYNSAIVNSSYSSIIGNESCICQSSYSSIIGGRQNNIRCNSTNSSIIGGVSNWICCSQNSSIIGGSGFLLKNTPNTVLVPNLIVSGSASIENKFLSYTFNQSFSGTGSNDANFVTWNYPGDRNQYDTITYSITINSNNNPVLNLSSPNTDFIYGESIVLPAYIDGAGNFNGSAQYAQPVMGQVIQPLDTGTLISVQAEVIMYYGDDIVTVYVYDSPGGSLLATSDNSISIPHGLLSDPWEGPYTWTFNSAGLTLNSGSNYFVALQSATFGFFVPTQYGVYPRGNHWIGSATPSLTEVSNSNISFILRYGNPASATVSGYLNDWSNGHSVALSGPSPFLDGDVVEGLISGATATILSQWTADTYTYQIDGLINSPIAGTSIASTSYYGISNNDILVTFDSTTGHAIGDTWKETIVSNYSEHSILSTVGGAEIFKVDTTGTYVKLGEFVVGGEPGLSPSEGKTRMASLSNDTIILNDLSYNFPETQGYGALLNDGTGGLTWSTNITDGADWVNPNANTWNIRTIYGGTAISFNGTDPVKWFDGSDYVIGSTYRFRGAIIEYHSINNVNTAIGSITIASDYNTSTAYHHEALSGNNTADSDTYWIQSQDKLYFTASTARDVMIQFTAKLFYGDEYFC